jgi:hypothetical protein
MSTAASSGWRKSRREDNALVRRLLYVAFFLEVGLLLIVVPWSGYWDRNYFAAVFPPLRSIIASNFVRGAVTGLGVVNVVAGLADLTVVFTGRWRKTTVDREPGHPAS